MHLRPPKHLWTAHMHRVEAARPCHPRMAYRPHCGRTPVWHTQRHLMCFEGQHWAVKPEGQGGVQFWSQPSVDTPLSGTPSAMSMHVGAWPSVAATSATKWKPDGPSVMRSPPTPPHSLMLPSLLPVAHACFWAHIVSQREGERHARSHLATCTCRDRRDVRKGKGLRNPPAPGQHLSPALPQQHNASWHHTAACFLYYELVSYNDDCLFRPCASNVAAMCQQM